MQNESLIKDWLKLKSFINFVRPLNCCNQVHNKLLHRIKAETCVIPEDIRQLTTLHRDQQNLRNFNMTMVYTSAHVPKSRYTICQIYNKDSIWSETKKYQPWQKCMSVASWMTRLAQRLRTNYCEESWKLAPQEFNMFSCH